jgi:hypothetical protein
MLNGNTLRDEGMTRSMSNAEDKNPGWKEQALSLLLDFLHNSPLTEFQAEDIRIYAYQKGLPKPPSHRAWGGVMVSARKKGFIQRIGYQNVTNPLAHSTPATLWKKSKHI